MVWRFLSRTRARASGRVAGVLTAACCVVTVPAFVRAAGAPPSLPWVADSVRTGRVEPTCTSVITSQDRAALWAPPLDRLVTLRVPEMPVREAVDRVAAVARLELSYSADLLPAAHVCLTVERVPVGAVLDHLLDGSTLRPIVLGSTQVVLAPSRVTAKADSPLVSRRSSMLDRVVVTGSPDGAAQRGSPFALDVLDGTQLAQHGVNTLGEALELSVPGFWSWGTTAGAVTTRYGSIRGASSFGVSAPKVYLDGIEVANPLLVTQIDPARVARVEVIRGPQGAALYGADAISGVVNILTRHDGTENGRLQLQLSTVAGMSSTAFAERNPFVQEHSLALRRGTASRNVGLGVNVGTIGAYVDGAAERRLLIDADGRFSRQRAIYTGFTRFALQRARAASDSVTGNRVREGEASGRMLIADSAPGQEMAQYTVGGSIAVMPSMQWTHTIIAGVDGYRLLGLSPYSLAGSLSPSSSLTGNAEGAADRASLRLRTVGRFDVTPGTLLTLTLGAEQSVTREVVTNASDVLGTGSDLANGGARMLAQSSMRAARLTPSSGLSRGTYDNSGFSAQLQLAWRDRWFASAGARAERTDGATPNPQQSLLPMLGAAHVREFGNTVLKLRGAFGTAIRPARSLLRTSSWMGQGQFASLSSLEPEKQSGTEFGADVLFGTRAAVHVTRFDQRATGLIQPVSSVVTLVGNNGRLNRAMTFSLQNVGAIANRGWELEATTHVCALSLAAALTVVDSRVAELAGDYHGDLRVGDRALDVPASTFSLTAAWVRGRWTLTSTAIRAADWIGYDRERIGSVLASGAQSPRDLEGASLRNWWVRYAGVTRWRAGASFRLRRDFALTAAGENLLNVQTGAPDNVSVIAGRTLTFGIRTIF